MEIEICKDIGECKKLWNSFDVKKTLFDFWDYRLCFHNKESFEPYFVAWRNQREILGLLPLSFCKETNQYNYFGGWFPERNKFFLKDKTKIAELLKHCPNDTFLEGIDPEEGKYYDFLEDEPTFFLDLSRYNHNFETYFGSFEKKKQKNISSEMKKLPQHKIFYNRFEDFGRLAELNMKQFEEDSKFLNKSIAQGIKRLFHAARTKNCLEMISVEIDGKVEAVDFGILHNKCYSAIIGGTNSQKIPNLGKLMLILDIKNAIAKNADFVDFFATTGNWKNSWNLESEMLLKFKK